MRVQIEFARTCFVLTLAQATEPAAIEYLLRCIAVLDRNLGLPLN